jgi:hypothetical protein
MLDPDLILDQSLHPDQEANQEIIEGNQEDQDHKIIIKYK